MTYAERTWFLWGLATGAVLAGILIGYAVLRAQSA